MKNKNSRKGHLVKMEFWQDWVRICRSQSRRGIVFEQSDIKKEGYNPRTLGIAIDERGTYYVAAAIYRDTESSASAYSGKGLVAKRIRSVMEKRQVDREDQMVTIVPENYLGLLWEDSYVYGSLFGKVDEKACRTAIKKLKKGKSRDRTLAHV